MPSWSCAAGAPVATAPLGAAVRWRSQNPTAATAPSASTTAPTASGLGRRLISVAGPAAIVASGRIVRCGSWWPPTSSALDPITVVRDLGRGSMIVAPAACSSVRSLASSGESGAASVSPASSARRGRARAQLGRVLEAIARLACHRPLDDVDEQRRRRRGALAQRHGLAVAQAGQHLVHRLVLEGALAGEDLVEDRAEREDVGARVGLLPAQLLGGHVVRSPHHRSAARQLGRAQLGEPEVEDLDVAARLDVDVAGLEVAVDDPARVRGGDAFRSAPSPPACGRDGRAPRADRLAEVDPSRNSIAMW